MQFTINCSDLFSGLEAFILQHIGPVCDEEFHKRIQALIEGDTELYNQMVAEHLADLNHEGNGNDNLVLGKINIRKELKTKALIQLMRISAMLNRRKRYSARISQGDFKSTTFTASMPVPPTMMKGGLHHTAKVGV